MKQLISPKEEKVINTMRLEIASRSENESFARSTVAAFASQLNPTLDEVNDIKTAVSEAVTNCVVHAYCKGVQFWRTTKQAQSKIQLPKTDLKSNHEKIVIACDLYKTGITISVTDFGVGISNIDKAMEPFFTTKPDDERSGMGFTVMQSFMDTLRVTSNTGGGTTVTMQKFFTIATTKEKRAVGDV